MANDNNKNSGFNINDFLVEGNEPETNIADNNINIDMSNEIEEDILPLNYNQQNNYTKPQTSPMFNRQEPEITSNKLPPEPAIGPTNTNARKKEIEELTFDKLKGFSNTEWEEALKDPSKLGLNNSDDVLETYIKANKSLIGDLTNELTELKSNPPKPKFNLSYEGAKNSGGSQSKKKYKKQIEELEKKKNKLSAKQEGLEYRKQRRKLKADYKEKFKDIDIRRQNLHSQNLSMDELKEASSLLDDEARVLSKGFKSADAMNKTIAKSGIKAQLGKSLTLMDIVNPLFAVQTGVSKYKESRSEGKGVVSSVLRGVGEIALAEMLSPVGYFAVDVARKLPPAAIKGANWLYQENRRMNSASNFIPLGGVNYQDNQELATMRQSGMELAKMSQYNLEQTLMGAEAKHLHR